MREVLDDLLRWWRSGEPVGMATVVGTWRSAPRPPGATMLVGPDGTAVGSVSGGCVEAAVYELCRERNRRGHVIADAVLTKPPSAELRPDQRDDQSLPPYDQLDPILEAYIEDDLTAGELVQAGYDADLVRRVVTLVDRAEYKRRQAPPGVRVTPKAFGKDRRLPITNRYTG